MFYDIIMQFFFIPIGELSSILSSWINSLKQYTLITVMAENHICTLLGNMAQFKLVFPVNIQKTLSKTSFREATSPNDVFSK